MTPTITSAEQQGFPLCSPTQTPFSAISSEQRREMNDRAIATRRSRSAVLRSDVAHDGLNPFHSDDRKEWDSLAAAAGVRLPPYGMPITRAGISRFLGKLRIPVPTYIEWDGGKTLADFGRRNPSWPMKALAGLILENRERMLRYATKAA